MAERAERFIDSRERRTKYKREECRRKYARSRPTNSRPHPEDRVYRERNDSLGKEGNGEREKERALLSVRHYDIRSPCTAVPGDASGISKISDKIRVSAKTEPALYYPPR